VKHFGLRRRQAIRLRLRQRDRVEVDGPLERLRGLAVRQALRGRRLGQRPGVAHLHVVAGILQSRILRVWPIDLRPEGAHVRDSVTVAAIRQRRRVAGHVYAADLRPLAWRRVAVAINGRCRVATDRDRAERE